MKLENILGTGVILGMLSGVPALAQDANAIEYVQNLEGNAYVFNINDRDSFYLANDPMRRIAEELEIGTDECRVLYAPVFNDSDGEPYLLTSGLRDPTERGGRVIFVTDKEDRFYERVPEQNLAEFRLGGSCGPVYLASLDTSSN